MLRHSALFLFYAVSANLTASFLGRAPLDGCTAPTLIGQCTARAQIDVVFLLDTTDQSDNIESVKSLIRQLSACVTVSDDATSIALLKYRAKLQTGIPLGAGPFGQARYKLTNHINSIRIKKSATFESNLGAALRSLINLMLGHGPVSEQFGKRANVPLILVIVTDHASDDAFHFERSRLLDAGIRIMTVGHTETGLETDYYNQLASKPLNENVFVYDRKDKIMMAKDSILTAICEESNNYLPEELTKDGTVSHVTIREPVSITSLSTLAVLEWNGANSGQGSTVTDYDVQLLGQPGYVDAAESRLQTRRYMNGFKHFLHLLSDPTY